MHLGSYEEWQLGWPSTPRAALAQLVRSATGDEIDRLDRILEGYSNEVYRVSCASGDEVVIRILRFDDDVSMSRAIDEAWAIGKAFRAGVPTAEVLLLDSVHLDGTDYPAMVQRAVPGQPLSKVIEKLSIERRHDVLSEVGRLMARLSAVPVDRPHDWNTAMEARLAARRADQPLILGAGFTAAQVRGMFELMEGYVRELSRQRVVLSHGDLSAKHIFVAGEPSVGVQVSGFIDFGDWTPGGAGARPGRSPRAQPRTGTRSTPGWPRTRWSRRLSAPTGPAHPAHCARRPDLPDRRTGSF